MPVNRSATQLAVGILVGVEPGKHWQLKALKLVYIHVGTLGVTDLQLSEHVGSNKFRKSREFL